MDYWLKDDFLEFPDPAKASPEGIVAVGGNLSTERLLKAYQAGVFPWSNPEDPLLWWCPDPRYVIYPSEIRVSKSMRPYFNQEKFQLSFDQEFEEVIHACSEIPRKGQLGGTWLSKDFIEAYKGLHEKGYAHSVEVWKNGELAGGLYGVCLGKCFFGESMFSRESNASKFGLISLARALEAKAFKFIDCQIGTAHLVRLGARPLSRKRFLQCLRENKAHETWRDSWQEYLSDA